MFKNIIALYNSDTKAGSRNIDAETDLLRNDIWFPSLSFLTSLAKFLPILQKCSFKQFAISRGSSTTPRDVNAFFAFVFFKKTCFFLRKKHVPKKRVFFSKKHGLKKNCFFLQILFSAGILIVLCYFLASDSNPISNGSHIFEI